MQIARKWAAIRSRRDMLRRAMGKKKPEEMAKQREVFTQGAIANNIDESIATYIFDLMEKFAGYASTSRIPPPTRWSPIRPPG